MRILCDIDLVNRNFWEICFHKFHGKDSKMNERYSRRNNDWQYNDQDNSWRFSDQSRGGGRQFESQRSSGSNEWPEQYGHEQRSQNRMGRDYNPSGRSQDFGSDPWGNDNNARVIRGDEDSYGSSSSSSYGLSSGYSGQHNRPYQSRQNFYSGEQFSGNQPYRYYRDRDEQQGQGTSSYSDEGPHSDYYRWREQQLKKLDEDYRSWRDERHKRFSEDFDEWRKNRPSTSEPSLSQSSGELSTSSGSSGGSFSSSGSGSSGGSSGSSGSGSSGSGGSSGSKSHEKGSSSSSK